MEKNQRVVWKLVARIRIIKLKKSKKQKKPDAVSAT